VGLRRRLVAFAAGLAVVAGCGVLSGCGAVDGSNGGDGASSRAGSAWADEAAAWISAYDAAAGSLGADEAPRVTDFYAADVMLDTLEQEYYGRIAVTEVDRSLLASSTRHDFGEVYLDGDLLISASCSRCEAVLGLSAVRKCTPWRAWIWAPRSGNPRGPGPACGGCVSPPLVWAPAVVEPPSLDSGSDAGADALSDVRDVIELPRGDLDDERVCLVVGEGEPVAVESQEGDGGR